MMLSDSPVHNAFEVLDALDQHRETLLCDAQRSDECGAIGADSVEVIRAAGGYRFTSEAAVGVVDIVRIGAGIAAYHPSAAWNCIVSNTNALLARRFTTLIGTSLPESPDTQWCGVFASSDSVAVNGPAGHVVRGSWKYASNSQLADWAVLNVAHEGLGAAFVLVPCTQLKAQTNWAALGLRGTGSIHSQPAT